jgi:hypothetical protein
MTLLCAAVFLGSGHGILFWIVTALGLIGMANTNTIKSQIVGVVQNNLQPLTNAVAGNTATAFSLLPGPVSGAGGGVIPLTPTVNSQSATWFGTSKKLKVRATGTVVTGAAMTLTLKLYLVPAVIAAGALANQTFTNWNLLATSTARACNTTTADWWFEAELQLSAIGTLSGIFKDCINDLFDAEAVVTAATLLTSDADLNFVLVSTLSVSNAANVNTAKEFSLEQV